jgi:tartrate dehydrogenase/decarboxylase/D-malate dehydrogenase
LTVVTKSSAQRHCLVVWDDIAAEVSEECPNVKWDSMPVDQLRQVRLTG